MDLAEEAALKDVVVAELDAVRRRSLDLLEPVPPHALVAQHSTIMSPLVWDLAHVGNYEDLWLLRGLGGAGVGPEHDAVYDPFRNARADRPNLPLLAPGPAHAYVREVREQVLEVLGRTPLSPERPLLAGAFVYGMVIQHEHQHVETMLATLQLMEGEGYRPVSGAPPRGSAPDPLEVEVPGGPFTMGTDSQAWAYDNERPAHVVDLPPFVIDATPVTNRSYRAFVESGGYEEPRWWTDGGWAWRRQTGCEHPQQWLPQPGGGWARNRFGWVEDLPEDEPVQHVCWYEADAYARWAGKRLPTEAEWEKAAAWDPSTGDVRRYPWGDRAPSQAEANLGQRHFGPAPVGAYPGGASPVGCQQMIGDVWEWTASDFTAYPGFRSFPYREYSEVFFDAGYKVLRGGSWATHALAVRSTFRNWDLPVRRQIFAGFRCARDADA